MIKFLLGVFIAFAFSYSAVFAFVRTDELYIDYHYFLHFTPNPKSAFDYVDHVNNRIDHALKKGESFAAKNLMELIDVYLTHGIPGLVGFDKTRTATESEMAHVLKSADFYTHILSAYYPKLEDWFKKVVLDDQKQCFSYALIYRNQCLNESISDEVGRRNGEAFASIVLGKKGITSDEFKDHCQSFKNDSINKSQDCSYYGPCKTESDFLFYRIIITNHVDFSWVQNITKNLNSLQKSWKDLSNFKIIAKPESSCGLAPILNSSFIDESLYYRVFMKQTTSADGSCFFHAVSQDNSNKATYDTFKNQVKDEKDPQKQEKFRNFLKEGMNRNSNFRYDLTKSYRELAETYFKNWEKTTNIPTWQCYPHIPNPSFPEQGASDSDYGYPSTLYCYLNDFCCHTYVNSASASCIYIPSFYKTTRCQFRFIIQQGNHFSMLIPKPIEG